MSITSKYSLPLAIIVLVSAITVSSVELDVGAKKGWVTPTNSDQFYNEWASKNRFKVNDTLRFQYEKDSVMVVTEEEYEKCRSTHPVFFSNNGDTVYTLDHSGLFYFISGVSGHCERGLKMIVKVLEPNAPSPSQVSNETTPSPPDHHKKSGAAKIVVPAAVSVSVIVSALFL